MSVPVSLAMNAPNFQMEDHARVRRVSSVIPTQPPQSPSANGINTESNRSALAHSPTAVVSVIYT